MSRSQPPVALRRTDANAAASQRDWIASIWACQDFSAAIEIASPALTTRINAILTGTVSDSRQVRRAALALLRYALRASTRATPFGLFAGVAPLGFTDEAVARMGAAHQVMARVEAVQLEQLIWECERELFPRFRVVANNLARVQAGRLSLLSIARTSDCEPREVTLRHTAAVEAVRQLAQTPVSCEELIAALARRFPWAAGAKITALVRTLMDQGVLLSQLRAPMSQPDPLRHLLDALPDQAKGEPAAFATARQMRSHLDAVSEARQVSTCRTALRSAAEHVRTRQSNPLAVDMRLDARVGIPASVVNEAEKAAVALLRLSRFPNGSPSWADYRDVFLERYGIGAIVPLGELLDPVAGVGFPAGFRDSLYARSSPSLTDRDRSLIALAHRTVCEGQLDVDLNTDDLAGLAAEDVVPAPHVGLAFHVRARSREDMNAGRYVLGVDGAARSVGTTEGRFLHLLDPAERERIATTWNELPTMIEGAQRVQLSGPPLYASTCNVARVPRMLPDHISLSEWPTGEEPARLEDLAVSAEIDRMFLVNRLNGRVVEPLLPNAVEPTTRMHPTQRFLAELPRAHTSTYATFDWGAAAALPVLPRLRLGRSILSPARWRIEPAQLPGHRSSWSEWIQHWDEIRKRLQLPDQVYLGNSDIRVRIDLNDEAHLVLLRTEIDRKGTAVLREAPTEADLGWINGRAHEITIPLATDTSPKPPPRGTTEAPRLSRSTEEHIPGASSWLYAKIYTHPSRFNELLTTDTDKLFSSWPTSPSWWFLRYLDPRPHLRLRIRLDESTSYGQAVERLGTWAAAMRTRGLIRDLTLDTYRPETGRYGYGEVMSAAEDVFATDTTVALTQIRHAQVTGTSHEALCAASLIEMAEVFTASGEDGTTWLLDHVNRSGAPLNRVHAAELDNLRNDGVPGDGPLDESESGQAVMAAWQRRRGALTAYRRALLETHQAPSNAVLSSLLHLHHIRAIGIDTDSERACLRLARNAALSSRARHHRSHA
ncbi:lantibiotic dehydratase [Natronoglycomyces albus]|uniref:Lantibiotic dehydratase n=1 Tax=Natronoglycomyces albus TaxID=2811108 RepID=A0A895XRY0_9ACTN|nr:lantibiotic dehydratase [Natronoglycomyces albus]QSB06452.1 lantibiotic dehydratase [Natronoglycomyces albus]